MNPYEAVQTYRESSIENAPPVKITRLLYEGALRFIDRAAACDARDPRSKFVHWLSRADAIVCELRVSLDHEQGQDVAEQLEALYVFCEERLTKSQAIRDAGPALEARKVLETLLDGWRQVELTVQEG